jgi:hypothetical protein
MTTRLIRVVPLLSLACSGTGAPRGRPPLPGGLANTAAAAAATGSASEAHQTMPYAPETFALLFGEMHWVLDSTSHACKPFRFTAGTTCPVGSQRVYLDSTPTATSLYGARISLETRAAATSSSGCIEGLTVVTALYPQQRPDDEDLVSLDPDIPSALSTTNYLLSADKAACEREAAQSADAARAEAARQAGIAQARAAERAEVCSGHAKPTMLQTGDRFGPASVMTPAALTVGLHAQVGPHDRIGLDTGTSALRYRGIALIGTTNEIANAARYLASSAPCRFAGMRFSTFEDLDYTAAVPDEIATIGRDAGASLRTQQTGWAVTCWECNAFEIVAALAALGVQADVVQPSGRAP